MLNILEIAREFKFEELISRSLQSGPTDAVPFQYMDSGEGREWWQLTPATAKQIKINIKKKKAAHSPEIYRIVHSLRV